MHPNCRCSVACWEDEVDYEEWLDFLDKGGATEGWNQFKNTKSRKLKGDEGVFQTINSGTKDIMEPKNIMNNLRQTNVGREALKHLEDNEIKVSMCYGVDSTDIYGTQRYGYFDPASREIVIFANETKTVQKTAEIVIHEAFHDITDMGGTRKEEAYCIMQERKHQKRSNSLTSSEIRDIIKLTNELYPELSWK